MGPAGRCFYNSLLPAIPDFRRRITDSRLWPDPQPGDGLYIPAPAARSTTAISA